MKGHYINVYKFAVIFIFCFNKQFGPYPIDYILWTKIKKKNLVVQHDI
jgi:hypothetical protein